MKNLIMIIVLAFVALVSTAQIRTINSDLIMNNDILQKNSVTWKYTGRAIDSLTINQDTLLYNVTINKAWPANYYIKVALDTIDGVDTTCVINIKGRMFDDEAWSLIETVTTSVISAEINTVIESITDADYTLGVASAVDIINQQTTTNADTINVAARTITPTVSIKPSWRQVQVEIIINGNDSVGKGIVLKDIEFYFQQTSN